MRIETSRLRMVPFTLELVEATLADRTRLKKLLRAEVPQNWPNNDYFQILPLMAKMLSQNRNQPVWNGLILRKYNPVLVGDMGLKGGPDGQGTVDLGYSIVPEYQRKGYATEMARALVEWALRQKEIRRVTAECLTSNVASVRVLEKTGFRRIMTDGNLIRWELVHNQKKDFGET